MNHAGSIKKFYFNLSVPHHIQLITVAFPLKCFILPNNLMEFMKKINRSTFLKQTFGLGSALYLMPTLGFSLPEKPRYSGQGQLWQDMVKANDQHIQQLLEKGDEANKHGGRSFGYNFAMLASAYCCADARFYEDPRVITLLDYTADKLIENQRPDGTINAGNLESPPDTAFIMEPLCAGVFILSQQSDAKLDGVKAKIKGFVLKTGEALVVGGIHTPNHRWVVCHALARINQLYPDPKYVERIDEWLSEGIYMDQDGHYPERSMNYSDVENNAFIAMGRLLDRPELYAAPRKSLEMTYYYMEPNGDLVTTDSRRQDQYSHRSIVVQYLHYRYLANYDQNGRFAKICQLIEGFPGFDRIVVEEALFHFMEDEQLRKELPVGEAVPVNFEKLFTTSSLARIRRENTTATIFGGVDWPLIIASGRSVSPNFFSYRKGKAILWYMRMSSSFFSMGHFRSHGLTKEDGKYMLYQKLEAPYYQPLPKALRKEDGDYELTPSVDGRFWSKMAFDKRPVSNVKTLESRVTIEESNGTVELLIDVSGLEGVKVTVEMCFDQGGRLKGVDKATQGEDNFFLADGQGVYEKDGDQITFGPGSKAHERISRLDGEQYSVHFGSLRTAGNHVYITGITPFTHKLTFQ
ncbi:hypothetical protein Echvi_3502 [Echinicola vietnamensis DSM 17526]|uniref:Heparinase II/III-like protein n=2 Tax=Echinicola TaxID=390846 RepID=L0G337_ECHVK|nr:hypothetical protein Echvi_3502 [Echinicola vietnamensis DSM 17526]